MTFFPIPGFHIWPTIGPSPWRNRPYGARRWPQWKELGRRSDAFELSNPSCFEL